MRWAFMSRDMVRNQSSRTCHKYVCLLRLRYTVAAIKRCQRTGSKMRMLTRHPMAICRLASVTG
jgi:hypothetical protein